MNKIIALVVVVVSMATTSWAANREDTRYYGMDIMIELEYIAELMAGDTQGCGVMYTPNIKVTMDKVVEYYMKTIDENATAKDVADWAADNTVDEYSEAVDFIDNAGCELFNVFVIDKEGDSKFTDSLLNYYQPIGL